MNKRTHKRIDAHQGEGGGGESRETEIMASDNTSLV